MSDSEISSQIYSDSDDDHIQSMYDKKDQKSKKVTFEQKQNSDSDDEFVKQYIRKSQNSDNSDESDSSIDYQTIKKQMKIDSDEDDSQNYQIKNKKFKHQESSNDSDDDQDVYKVKHKLDNVQKLENNIHKKVDQVYENQEKQKIQTKLQFNQQQEMNNTLQAKNKTFLSQINKNNKIDNTQNFISKPEIRKIHSQNELQISQEQIQKFEQNFQNKYQHLNQINISQKNQDLTQKDKQSGLLLNKQIANKQDIQEIKRKYSAHVETSSNQEQKIQNNTNYLTNQQILSKEQELKKYQENKQIQFLQKQLEEKDKKENELTENNLFLKNQNDKFKKIIDQLQQELQYIKNNQIQEQNEKQQQTIKPIIKKEIKTEKKEVKVESFNDQEFQQQIDLLKTIDKIKEKIQIQMNEKQMIQKNKNEKEKLNKQSSTPQKSSQKQKRPLTGQQSKIMKK